VIGASLVDRALAEQQQNGDKTRGEHLEQVG